jgi:signal transduction histidine kinase
MILPGMNEPERRGAFASMVAHELRTPLTAAYGALEMMARTIQGVGLEGTGLEGDRNAALLGLAHRNTARLLHIVEDCLDLEAASDGRLTLAGTLVDAGEIVALGIDGAISAREQSAVETELRLGARQRFTGDRFRLGRAITHLVQNAVTFAPPGSTVLVTTSDDEERAIVRISVENRGAGISPDHLRALFQRFDVRETPGRRRVGGIGMGLAFVRAIVELHEGCVGAESGEGRTVFWVELPVRR